MRKYSRDLIDCNSWNNPIPNFTENFTKLLPKYFKNLWKLFYKFLLNI